LINPETGRSLLPKTHTGQEHIDIYNLKEKKIPQLAATRDSIPILDQSSSQGLPSQCLCGAM